MLRVKIGVRGKLIILAVGTAVCALLLACASFVYYDRTSYAAAKQRSSKVLVESVSNSMFGPMAFHDEDSAKTVLNVLATEPTADAAAAYTADGTLLASWQREGSKRISSTHDKTQVDGYRSQQLQLTADIKQSDAPAVGYLRVLFTTTDIQQRTERFLQIAGSVLFVASLLAIGLAFVAASILTRPIKLLYAAAMSVQEQKDLTVRAQRVSNDELGKLTDAFNAMLAMIQTRDHELERHRLELEDLVAARTRSLDERNREMRLVFDNVDQGFVTLDRDCRLGSEHSAIVAKWFGEPQEQATLPGYFQPLSAEFSMSFEMHWSQLIEGMLPMALNLAQLPSRFQTTSGRHYELAYQPIDVSDDRFEKLLVIMTDVTARVEKERSDAEQGQLMALFENVTNDRAGFNDFMEEADRLVTALTGAMERDLPVVLRELHTLKGNFGLFSLKPLAHLVHGLESACIDQQAPLTAAQRALLEEAWQRFRDRAKVFLGQHASTLSIAKEEVEAIVSALRGGATPERVSHMLTNLCNEPVAPKLARLAQHARGLARRLGKGDIEVQTDSNGVRMSHEHAWLWHVLPHAINNSVDHGLPDPEEAKQAGSLGKLRFAVSEHPHELHVEIEDFGRGIDWDRVRAKGQALGMRVDDHAALVDVIFAQGVSTRDTATDVSGRGVGLSALKEACDAHHAKIELKSRLGHGTLLRIIIKAPGSQQAANDNQARSRAG
jgi:two-component system chemotaxis sensor kinase CheA